MSKHKMWPVLLAGSLLIAMTGPASASDWFTSWSQIEATQCYQKGYNYDYQIQIIRNSPDRCEGNEETRRWRYNLAMAIHGGEVEPWTDELVSEINFTDYVFDMYTRCIYFQANQYVLDVHVQPGTCTLDLGFFDVTINKSNSDLHLTSTDFDEPGALDMVNDAYSIVSIHGMRDERYTGPSPGHERIVCVGGLNDDMRDGFISAVENDPLLSPFLKAVDARDPSLGCPDDLSGTEANNIVNRSPSNPNGGLQLEFSRTARDDLFEVGHESELQRLVVIIQDVMHAESAEYQ
ncbi:poly-gamma-glutamate hydrolase family protein [Haliangium sp.]|uniref:poly-gamma-glutamate hydrolase family protein n=1 Tax=Haliangium sp. TaxID=2663208 RepID=UPI003D09E039